MSLLLSIDDLSMTFTTDRIWHGLTVCNQQEIPVFLQVPGKKFLSIEPCWGEINPKYWYSAHCWHNWITGETGVGRTTDNYMSHWQTGKKIDAVILGGETLGNKMGRLMRLGWVDKIVEQCEVAGVPLFTSAR